MKRQTSLSLLLFSLTPLPAQENGIDQNLELVTYPSGEKVIAWYGHVGRSYFVQASVPTDRLNKWTWAPIIEGGNDEEISHEVNGTADKGFFRLQYTDQVPGPGENLDTADFDGDGISNKDEVEPGELLTPTNPLNPDTDGDGLPDGWERNHGLNPNDSSDAASLFTGSSVTNLEAFNSGVQADPNATPTNKDGDGAEDIVDADPNDKVVDWAPAAEASYAVIELEQEDYSDYPYGDSPYAAFSASIGNGNTVLWHDGMLDADTNDWHERYRVWKNGDWTTDITAQPIEFTSIAMSTLYESVKDESNPGTWTSIEMAADCVGSTPNAVCGDLILGIGNYLGSNSALPVRHLGYDAEGNPTDETRNDGYASVDACYVANLWTLGADTITADPIDPPSMAKFMGLNYFDSSAPLYGVYDYRALASPGGALAILGTQATQYEGLWKIWNPPTGAGPYIPGVGSPTLIDCEDSSHNKLWIKAIEDGGVVVGERNDLYVLTNPQTIPYQVANDHGVESKLPGSDGATHKALAICRVPTGVSGQSRLVAAGTDLWVQKDGQWRLATHKPTVNPIIAVADDGVLLGSQSIWRNGNEITLDKLVETNTVQQSGQTLVRYTNLRAYAMNSKGAIVALADDKLNSGDKHKTLVLLLPVEFDAMSGRINYGFDPPMKGLPSAQPPVPDDAPGEMPWASAVRGRATDNQNVRFLLPQPMADKTQLKVVSGSADLSLIPNESPLSAAETTLTLAGLNPANKTIATAQVEAQLISNSQKMSALNVMILPERTVSLGIYRVTDPDSAGTSPVDGPTNDEILNTLKEVYKQAGITFRLDSSGDKYISYDVNQDGKVQGTEVKSIIDNLEPEPVKMKVILAKNSGIPYPEDATRCARGASNNLTIPRSYGILFVTDCEASGVDLSVAAAHEVGHVLDCTVRNPDINDHDPGPFPIALGADGLMKSGAPKNGILPKPGRWLAHEDWDKANLKAIEHE